MFPFYHHSGKRRDYTYFSIRHRNELFSRAVSVPEIFLDSFFPYSGLFYLSDFFSIFSPKCSGILSPLSLSAHWLCNSQEKINHFSVLVVSISLPCVYNTNHNIYNNNNNNIIIICRSLCIKSDLLLSDQKLTTHLNLFQTVWHHLSERFCKKKK